MYPDHWDDYMWIVILGAFMSFFMAYGIGANDVANAFGTSVGAKTITLKQACLIAAVFEFSGAIGLGGEVTKTIAGGIARPDAFLQNPEIFAFGMLVSLFSAASCVAVATYFCLAVSTTHAIIGAIMGYALVWGGKDAVVWNDHQDAFPYSKGFVPVVCSWFVSPIMSGIISGILFFFNRLIILRRENSTTWAIYSYPFLVGITVFINMFFVLFKGAKSSLKWPSDKAAWVAAIIGACVFVLAVFPGIWLLKRIVQSDMDHHARKAAEAEAAKDKEPDDEEAANPEPSSKAMKVWNSLKKAATRGLEIDIHEDVKHSKEVHDIHAAAEVFNPETEQVYKYLQVFSACAVSFAHGANDVANAVGPFAAIWYVYRKWAVASKEAESPYWILALGGAGIVVGLATLGYKVMATLGVGLAKFTPCRGYCAEIATSLSVALASVYGLPVSTTQCITGAEVGVGLVENVKTGVNYKLLAKQVVAWAMTLISAGFVSAAVFSLGVFSPSLTMAKDLAVYETRIRAASESLYGKLNASNYALSAAFSDKPFDAALNATIKSRVDKFKAMYNTKVIGYIDPYTLADQLDLAVNTYANYTVIVTGFNPSTKAYTAPGQALADNKVTVDPYTTAQLQKK